jgi:hypothetical protein
MLDKEHFFVLVIWHMLVTIAWQINALLSHSPNILRAHYKEHKIQKKLISDIWGGGGVYVHENNYDWQNCSWQDQTRLCERYMYMGLGGAEVWLHTLTSTIV